MSDGDALLAIVRQVLTRGVAGERFEPSAGRLSDALGEPGATFVTLTDEHGLRGCRGSLEARQPLGLDLAKNAWLTAFEDPRFPPVAAHELAALTIDVSLLSPLEPITAKSREDLLDALAPGEDGLLIEAGLLRATFLPKVWESLSEPEAFLDALWRKGGFPSGRWPSELKAWRYRTEVISGRWQLQ